MATKKAIQDAYPMQNPSLQTFFWAFYGMCHIRMPCASRWLVWRRWWSRASMRPPCSIAAPAKAICVPTPRFDPVLCSIAAGSKIFRVLLSRVVKSPLTNCQGMPLRRGTDDKLYYSNRRFRLTDKHHQHSNPSLGSRQPKPKRRKSTAAFMVRAIKRRVSP